MLDPLLVSSAAVLAVGAAGYFTLLRRLKRLSGRPDLLEMTWVAASLAPAAAYAVVKLLKALSLWG